MKLYSKNLSLLFIGSLIIGWLSISVNFFLIKNKPIPSNSTNLSINTKIEEIKLENKDFNLIYENGEDTFFKSLIYLKDNNYLNYLIDKKSGEYLTFTSLLKEEQNIAFQVKESYLLSLKYPEFITKTITENSSGTGYKNYLVKDNEVIIYYYDYIFPYDYKETIFLKINYNEIKDFLSFSPKLDEVYQNETGYDLNKDENSVKKKVIALTFDDGPSSTYNKLILEELNKNQAHATFFMVGKMMENCHKCVVDTYKSGNEVASHTYEHINIKTNNLNKVNNSLDKVNAIYNSLTGDNIKYLRPPYGAYSQNNLNNATTPYILWDLDTEDWRYRDVNHIVNYVLENAHDGGIILMHELYPTTYEALKVLLPNLYVRGYQVVSISELFKIKNKTPEVGKAYRHLRY